MREFKVGDVVALKGSRNCDGPRMVIERFGRSMSFDIDEAHLPSNPHGETHYKPPVLTTMAHCVWYSYSNKGCRMRRDVFVVETLEYSDG